MKFKKAGYFVVAGIIGLCLLILAALYIISGGFMKRPISNPGTKITQRSMMIRGSASPPWGFLRQIIIIYSPGKSNSTPMIPWCFPLCGQFPRNRRG